MIKLLQRRLPEVALIASLFLLLYRWDLGWFNTHMSRDFYRAFQWLHLNFESWLGPELGDDFKRLPGPAYYLFLAPFMMFNSLVPALIGKSLFTVGSIYLLSNEIRKRFPQLSNVFILLFFASPFFIFTGRNFWNPSLVVALNCLQFHFFLKLENTKEVKWQWLIFALAFFAVQVHFSTLLIFLSICLTVLASPQFSKRTKLHQLGIFLLIGVFLGLWYTLNFVPEFDRQIFNYIGFNKYFINRIIDLNSFVSLYVHYLGDYNLFSLLCRSLNELGLFDQHIHFLIIGGFSWSMLGAFVFGIALSFKKFKSEKSAVYLFAALHAIIFFISILIIRNKPNVPYRYGLSLFPVQFFLISATIHSIIEKWPKFKFLLKTALPALLVCYYMFFNFKMLEAQEITGRTHNTFDDNLEMTIANKLKVYDLITGDLTTDPFAQLHGRAMNRFRLKEFDWTHRKNYFSLFRMARGAVPHFDKDISQMDPTPGFLVELKNLEELKSDRNSALKISKLELVQLPKNLEIVYFDRESKEFLERPWPNSSLILPLNFVDKPEVPDEIHLHFTISTTNGSYLNVLLNDHDRMIGAYPRDFIVKEFRVDGVTAAPAAVYIGNFLVQNQYVIKLPPGESHDVKILLKVGVNYANASRVDIYTTKDIPPAEELF